jgi:hypothetical protein
VTYNIKGRMSTTKEIAVKHIQPNFNIDLQIYKGRNSLKEFKNVA